MQRRGQKRIPILLSVRIWGMDAAGKAFIEDVKTFDITACGARLQGLHCRQKPGDVIGVQHAGEKARFKVVWVGAPNTPLQGQIGVFCLEPQKNIWGPALSPAMISDWAGMGQNSTPAAEPPPAAASAAPASPCPAPAAPAAALGSEQISTRMKDAITELHQLESVIEAGPVDPRILADFREAINHVRQTAWVVQQWIELSEYHKDAYTTLSLMTNERVRCEIQLTQELISDLDAGDLGYETDKIEVLAEIVQKLASRLSHLLRARAS